MTEVRPARSASMVASVPRSLLTGSESPTEAERARQAQREVSVSDSRSARTVLSPTAAGAPSVRHA
jgi:hypothetical protein